VKETRTPSEQSGGVFVFARFLQNVSSAFSGNYASGVRKYLKMLVLDAVDLKTNHLAAGYSWDGNSSHVNLLRK
jgi:hypothetical protein